MLSIRHIVKQYANHTALDDVSLEISKGSIFGLLGPNGAGKTSLIRIINQITAPDSGEIYFNNEKLNASHINRIGYLPEERGLYKKMEIGEQILYLAQLKGLSRHEAVKRVRYWFERLGVESWWKKKVEDLSKGMQQKIQFIATVVHQPELIILDEPFSGFDPVNAALIKDEILELNRQGATIIFSTHRMESVEQLCDHIALINQSRKILDGPLKAIRDSYRSQTFSLEYSGVLNDVTDTPLFEVKSQQVDDNGGKITVKLNEGVTPNQLLSYFIPRVTIHELHEVIPTINDIFIRKVKNLDPQAETNNIGPN
ncbi:ATP-binding cassette domain-containing protein [Pedobacter sp. BS3]|uniref:ABC transporter ATP-binding protein n=1 Tax=Pedobacter sp. BS3 TaxID=2567937 RepID=UPI0011EF0168|nr:ABC transporter ATP-binding protein [Pedobacter sp. BS3]TZF82668.1 ATP-binding cassette domain-containing protein [Pedobacter sp. BS3]